MGKQSEPSNADSTISSNNWFIYLCLIVVVVIVVLILVFMFIPNSPIPSSMLCQRYGKFFWNFNSIFMTLRLRNESFLFEYTKIKINLAWYNPIYFPNEFYFISNNIGSHSTNSIFLLHSISISNLSSSNAVVKKKKKNSGLWIQTTDDLTYWKMKAKTRKENWMYWSWIFPVEKLNTMTDDFDIIIS